MPNYCYTCAACGAHSDIFCGVNDERTVTECCGVPMYHDFHRERFGGITHRSKGIYPFVCEDLHPQGIPLEIQSYQHHERLLKQHGRAFHQKNPENVYRRKHIKDFAGGDRKR